MQLADGGGGNFWAHDNTVVNVGNTGIGIVSGENCTIENNRIFGDGITSPSGVGIYVRNYYPGTVCKNNTIKNNKVFTWDSAWRSPPIISNYGSDGTCDEGLVVIGNTFDPTNIPTLYSDPHDPTLSARMFDEEYIEPCLQLLPIPPTPPSVTMNTSSGSIAYRGSTTLTWSSINASSCSTPWGSTVTFGTYTTPPLTVSTLYTVSCTGSGGINSASVGVTVATTGLGSTPHVFWASYPIRPDETVLFR